jgi:hypothetical protein
VTLGQMYEELQKTLECLPKSRAQSLAITYLQDSILWAQVAYSGAEDPLAFIQKLEEAALLNRK